MKTSTTVAWIVAVVLVIALIGWGLTRATHPSNVSGDQNATSTGESTSSPAGTNTSSGNSTSGNGKSPNLGEYYANVPYGFTFSYPRNLTAQSFDNFHELNQNDWKYTATPAKRGTPVVSVSVIEINNEQSGTTTKKYPLYYTAQVRIGVSTDTAQCYAKDDGYTNQTVTNVSIGGITWKKFLFGDAATMKYVNGASYRTIHNNKCYVVEQIENGSSYRDPSMTGGYTDAPLKAFYNETSPIVMSFRFSK